VEEDLDLILPLAAEGKSSPASLAICHISPSQLPATGTKGAQFRHADFSFLSAVCPIKIGRGANLGRKCTIIVVLMYSL
jgi:hypothetical protein